MRPVLLITCLLYTTIEASLLHGSIGVPSLYDNYHGEYAGSYDNYEPRAYSFEYGVSDPHTGDHKTQWETKGKDGVVRGSYSLLEPDGSTRIVDYIADDHGFRAVVRKVGIHGHLEKVEGHGGAEASVSTAPVATQPIVAAYNSYDGGVEDYSNLQPVAQNVYSAPSVDIRQVPQQILEKPLYFEGQQQGYLSDGALALGEGVPQYLLSKLAVPELAAPLGNLDCDHGQKLAVSYVEQPRYEQAVYVPEAKFGIGKEALSYVNDQTIADQEVFYAPETLSKGVEWNQKELVGYSPQAQLVHQQPIEYEAPRHQLYAQPIVLRKELQVPQQQLVVDQKLGPAYSYVQRELISEGPRQAVLAEAPKEYLKYDAPKYESLAFAQPLAGYNVDVNYGSEEGYSHPAPC